jgi:hypothetical protein
MKNRRSLAVIGDAGTTADARIQVRARGPVTALLGVACECETESQRMTVCPWEHPPVTCGDFVPSVLRSNY